MKLILIVFLYTLGILLGIYGFHSKIWIYPSFITITPYGDQVDQGNSNTSISKHENGAQLNWNFKSGFQYPYTGVFWTLYQNGKCADLSHSLGIAYSIDSDQNMSYTIKLYEFLNGWSQINNEQTYRPHMARIWHLSGNSFEKREEFNRFAVPDWWYVKYPQSPHPQENLENICEIAIAFNGQPGEHGSAILKSLYIYGNKRAIWASLIICFFTTILLFIWGYSNFVSTRKRIKHLENQLEIKKNAKVTLVDPLEEWSLIKENIEKYWNDPELQISKIADKTSIPPYKIAIIIKEETGLTFKAMLNKIRLENAETLLIETQEQVAQISNQCGYATLTHFYRLFKAKHNLSPKEWRDAQEKKG